MDIGVVNPWRRSSVDVITVETTTRSVDVNRILYLPVARRADLISLDNVVHRVPPFIKHRSQALVLRAHSWEAAALNSDEAVEIRYNISRRIPDTPVAMLSWDGERHRLGYLAGPELNCSASDSSSIVHALRQAELSAMVHRPGVLLPAHPNYHYLAPNGSHYRSYVRVGNAFGSTDTIDAGVFWLLPHLKSRPVIVLDSWTILPLGLNCFRYVGEAAGAVAKARRDPYEYLVECPRSYGEVDELAIRLKRIQEEAGDRPLLFVASVTSSGRFAEDIIEVCEQAGFERRETVSLFRGPTPMPTISGTVFCVLDEDFTRCEPKSCQYCESGSATVKLEGRSFSVEIAAGVSRTSLTKAGAALGKSLLELYAGSGLIKVHRDDRLRHHMVDLDVSALLSSTTGRAFRERLAEEATKLKNKVSAVLAPTHEAARQIAELVGACTDAPVVLAEQNALTHLPEAHREVLESAESILFVDDVVVTGSRLLSYRNRLREANLMTEGKTLRCLIGMARASTEKELSGIKDMLHEPHNFASVESFFLPNWGRDDCPWCLELRHLERNSEEFRESQLIRRRFERLRNTADGLTSELFIPWNDPSTSGLTLGAGSIFGMGNQAELFFSVAVSMQQLRDKELLDEVYLPPISKTLEPTKYWLRFYEPIIIACILRASRAHDLRSTLHDHRVGLILKNLFVEPMTTDLRSELLYATSRGKLPSIHDAATRDQLLKEADDGVSRLMVTLFERAAM